MAYINNTGYITRNQRIGMPSRTTGSTKTWWLPIYYSNNRLMINIGTVSIPEKYKGKRIRFRIEIVEDGDEKTIGGE